MGIPQVTCNADSVLSYSAGAQTVQLGASSSETAIQYYWELLYAPPTSTAFSETRGDFTNGIATMQAPEFVTDAGIEGTYVFQCIITSDTNDDSVPLTDKENGQQLIVVKTETGDLALPGDYQWRWGGYVNSSLQKLENLSGPASVITETGGPTNLDVGDIADGEFLKRSGSNIVGGSAGAVDDENAGVTASDTNPGYLNEKINPVNGIEKSVGSPSGDETLDLTPTYGSAVNTVAQGNDARFPTSDEKAALAGTGTPAAGNPYVSDDDSRMTDSRAPTAHDLNVHGSATLAELNAVVSDATLIDTTDSRLSDDRDPTAHTHAHADTTGKTTDDHHARDHAATHGPGATDALRLDDLEAPQDNTDLNVSTAAHGLAPKLSNVATEYLNGQGAYTVPAGGGGSSTFADLTDTPATLSGQAGKIPIVNDDEDALEFQSRGSFTPQTRVEALRFIPSGSVTTVSSSYVLATGATDTFIAPHGGLYRVKVYHESYVVTVPASTEFRLRFDVAGTPIVVGGTDKIWGHRFGGSADSYPEQMVFEGEVELTAGSHTVDFEWRTDSGTLSMNATTGYVYVVLESIGGSGLGGEITNYLQRGDNSDTVSSVNPTFIQPTYSAATYWEVTVDVQENEEVIIEFEGQFRSIDGSLSSAFYRIYHVEGAAAVGSFKISSSTASTVYTDMTIQRKSGQLSAGQHTFRLEVCKGSGTSDFVLQSCSMIIRQMKGGMAPVYQDDETTAIASQYTARRVRGMVASINADGELEEQYPIAATAPSHSVRLDAYDNLSTSPHLNTGTTQLVLTDSIVVPADMEYRVDLYTSPVVDWLTSNSTFRFWMVFDEGESYAQTIGSPTSIESGDNWGYRKWSAFTGPEIIPDLHFGHPGVRLTPGTHTVKVYARRSDGASDMWWDFSVHTTNLFVFLQSIAGSGLGGTILDSKQVNNKVVSGTYSPLAMQAITELTLDFTASEDEDVLIKLSGNSFMPTAGAANAHVQIVLDGVTTLWPGANAPAYMPSQYHRGNLAMDVFTGPLSAGPHQVTFNMAKYDSGNANWTVQRANAYAIQNRGGQFEVYNGADRIASTFGALQALDGIEASISGGKLQLRRDAVAEGLNFVQDTISADYTLTTGWLDTGHSVDVTAGANEVVLLSFSGRWSRTSIDMNPSLGYVINSDPVVILDNDWVPSSDSTEGIGLCIPVQMPATPGTHTIKLQARLTTGSGVLKGTAAGVPSNLSVIWARGGYVKSENRPVLKTGSFSGSTFSLTNAPGASTRFELLLNSGVRYYLDGDQAITLATKTGDGDREPSYDPVANGFQYIYAVPDSGNLAKVIVSDQSPDDGGPTDFDEWKYLCHVNRVSGSLIAVIQDGGKYGTEERQIAYDDGTSAVTKANRSLSTWLPPGCKFADLSFQLYAAVDNADLVRTQIWAKNATNWQHALYQNRLGRDVDKVSDFPIIDESIDYEVSVFGSQTIASSRIHVYGWRDPWLQSNQSQAQAKYLPNPVTAQASTPLALTSEDSGKLYTNEGATAEIVFNLPSAVAGLEYSFIVQDTDGIQINAASGDTIRIAASVSAAAGLIETTTVGNAVKLKAINATEWVAMSHEGTWTVT